MFSQEPDIFELAVPEGMKGISIRPFETEWGVTDELLCYYENTLIGLVENKIAQPNFLGLKTMLVYLLPKADRNRAYALPTFSEFSKALNRLLSENAIWNLRCEYDCEQYPVVKIENNISETIKELESALLYSIGKVQSCPTFNARNGDG